VLPFKTKGPLRRAFFVFGAEYKSVVSGSGVPPALHQFVIPAKAGTQPSFGKLAGSQRNRVPAVTGMKWKGDPAPPSR